MTGSVVVKPIMSPLSERKFIRIHAAYAAHLIQLIASEALRSSDA